MLSSHSHSGFPRYRNNPALTLITTFKRSWKQISNLLLSWPLLQD